VNLGSEKYVSVTTFRKDGTPVATPVWCAQDGDALLFWTVTDSGKVKRLRRDPAVTVAPCDVQGRLTGEPVAGQARILSAAETERVRGLLRRKYGLLGRITLLGSRIRRGPTGTVAVRVTEI
jgi:uncharacterized protein